MNYKKQYDLLIEKYGCEKKPKFTYVERHRKVPGCMGGNYEAGNAFYVSARVHYLAHRLLAKIYPDVPGIRVADYLMNKSFNKTNSKFYEESKLILSSIARNTAAENQKLGKAIFAQTKEERSEAGKKGGRITGPKGGKTQGGINAKNGNLEKARSFINWDNVSKVQSERFNSFSFEQRSIYSKKAAGKNWKCSVCGMIGNAGTIGCHQIKSKHSGRIKNNVSA